MAPMSVELAKNLGAQATDPACGCPMRIEHYTGTRRYPTPKIGQHQKSLGFRSKPVELFSLRGCSLLANTNLHSGQQTHNYS